MFLQHDDPHRHTAPDIATVYYFLILAPILVALVLFLGSKVIKYIENRKGPNRRERIDSLAGSDEKEG